MRITVILTVILLVGFFLRFYHLSDFPASLSHDEVAIGYNAYSVLHTGNDEYGTSFPLLFRSFDDYKPSGMIYITAFSIALFGLNEFGVRFPSALLGTLSILAFYFLVKEIMREKKSLSIGRFTLHPSLIATFFFSISIWHINFSRQAFETNGSLFFLLLGTYFLLRFLSDRYSLLFASFCYATSLYFYYTARLMLPFILITFAVLFRKQIAQNFKIVLGGVLLGFLLLLPFLPYVFSRGGFSRINIVSVVNEKIYLEKKEHFAKVAAENQNLATRFFYNRRFALFETILGNYFKNLSPEHIFVTGTDHSGLLYLFEIPLLFFGIMALLRLKHPAKWVLFVWFLAVPLAGGLTTDQPNALRTLPNAPVFSLFSGLGFMRMIELLRHRLSKKIGLIIFTFLFFVFFIRFLFLYFDYYPRIFSLHFGDGYKQMVRYVEKVEANYEKVYISGYYWRPYIFVLFWKGYNPLSYQREGDRDHFGKYYFGRATWDQEGLLFTDYSFDFNAHAGAAKEKTLFILAQPEYEIHQNKFTKLASIDGRFAKNVFVAVLLK